MYLHLSGVALAGINWLETELTNELHHSRFPHGIVAGNQHDGLDPSQALSALHQSPDHILAMPDPGSS
jgi:hypothetical protein